MGECRLFVSFNGNYIIKNGLFYENIFKNLIHCFIFGFNFENKLVNISMENTLLKMTCFNMKYYSKNWFIVL